MRLSHSPQIPFLLPENQYKGVMGVMGALRGSNLVVGAAFFALVVVTIPFSTMGILIMRCKCKAANCCGLCGTRFGCTVLFVAMTLLAILGLVLLPVSIVFNDVCILMDTLPKVRSSMTPSDLCWNNCGPSPWHHTHNNRTCTRDEQGVKE